MINSIKMNPRDVRSHSISYSYLPLNKEFLIRDSELQYSQSHNINPSQSHSQHQDYNPLRTAVSSPSTHFYRERRDSIAELKLPSLYPLTKYEASQTVLPSLEQVLHTTMEPLQTNYSLPHLNYSNLPTSIYSHSQSNHNNVKRPRRKFHEVRRIYACNYYGCTKAYGALNHLNSHILTQGHGRRRRACEFHHITRS